MTHETAAARKSPERYEATPAEFIFAPSVHTIENVDRIVDSLEECDIVALECSGGTQEERQELQDALNVIAAPDAPHGLKEEARRKLRKERTNEFLILLAERFEGKKLALIDLDDDHYGSELLERGDELGDAFLDAVEENRPNVQVKAAMLGALKAEAAASAAREMRMAEQLKELGNDNPGTKIGALVGMVHTSVQHEIAAQFPMTRRFISEPDDSLEPVEKVRYRYGEELERRYNLTSGKEPDDGLIDRTLLEVFFEWYGFTASGRLERHGSARTRVIENMDDSEVRQALAQVERIRMSYDEARDGGRVADEAVELFTRYLNVYGTA